MKQRYIMGLVLVAIALGAAWGAARWPGAETPGRERGDAVAAVDRQWGEDELRDGWEVEFAGELWDVGNLGEVFTDIGESSGQALRNDYEAQMERWIAARGEEGRDQRISELLGDWVKAAPEEALNWLEARATGTERARFLADALQFWAEDDLIAAAGWVAGMAQDQTKQQALEAMLEAWPAADRVEAAEWLESELAPGPIREAGRKALLLAWAREDWVAAKSWFEALEAPGRVRALTALLEAEGGRQPDRAVDLLAEEFENPNFSELATVWLEAVAGAEPEHGLAWLSDFAETADAALWSAFVYEWSQHAPGSAWDALANAPEGTPREDSAFALFLRWAASDAATASEQLGAIEEGQLRDAAVEGFSTGLIPFDPETSLAWASAIEDPELRTIQRRALIEAWAEQDPRAAARWLEETGEW